MAIQYVTRPPCATLTHGAGQGPPAVAFISQPGDGLDWRPCCRDCLIDYYHIAAAGSPVVSVNVSRIFPSNPAHSAELAVFAPGAEPYDPATVHQRGLNAYHEPTLIVDETGLCLDCGAPLAEWFQQPTAIQIDHAMREMRDPPPPRTGWACSADPRHGPNVPPFKLSPFRAWRHPTRQQEASRELPREARLPDGSEDEVR